MQSATQTTTHVEFQGADITRALSAWSQGERGGMDRALPLVYADLRAIAARALRGERAGHTLTPTALVHEAWLRMAALDAIRWEGRQHFFGACAHAMRRVLVDHARRRSAGKREGARNAIALEDAMLVAESRPGELLDLDEALARLAVIAPRAAKVVELRFFAGMRIEETAQALEISLATAKRDWTAARAWLNRELTS